MQNRMSFSEILYGHIWASFLMRWEWGREAQNISYPITYLGKVKHHFVIFFVIIFQKYYFITIIITRAATIT